MASSSNLPPPIPATVHKQLGGGVQLASLRSHGLQEAHRKARDAAHEAGDDRPLVLVVPAAGDPGGTLYVVQSCRLPDLIAAGTCEGAQIVRLTRRLVREHLDQVPSDPNPESEPKTHAPDLSRDQALRGTHDGPPDPATNPDGDWPF